MLYAVYGADGFGRETMSFLTDSLAAKSGTPPDIVFVDDGKEGGESNGYPIIGFEQAVDEQRRVCIAVAESRVRHKLAEKCTAAGLKFFDAQAPTHLRGDNCEAEQGGVFASFTMLTTNVRIGQHCHLNIYSYIAHDCIIGDFVTFAPSVKVNGRCIIEDHAYIGTGAVLRQGTHDKPLTIGAGAVVGMGAVVTKDVAPGTTVIGNPARPMEQRITGKPATSP